MQKIFDRLSPVLWALLIYAGFLIYGVSGHDDPHGNLWFAYTLREYGTFFNYNGESVQQNTSLLQVFMAVLLSGILPADLITCGYMVEVIAAFGCCVVLKKTCKKFAPNLSFWPALLMLSSPSFSLWIYGGMGNVLAAFCLLVSVLVWWWYVEFPDKGFSQIFIIIFVVVMLAVVRPETPLVAVAVSLFLCILHWRDCQRRNRFLHIFMISGLALALIFFWQYCFFGSWLPMPIQAKMSSFVERLVAGINYLRFGLLANPMVPFSLLIFSYIMWVFIRGQYFRVPWQKGQPLLTLLLVSTSFVACYTCFILLVGGDWMQAGRFMVPMVPISSLVVVLFISIFLRYGWAAKVLVLVLMYMGFRFTPSILAWGNHGVPLWVQYRLLPSHEDASVFEKYNQEHLRDLAVIDHIGKIVPQLHKGLGRPVRLLSGQLGMTYYRVSQKFYGTGQLKLYDFRGAFDGSLLNCPTAREFGVTSMGLHWTYPDYLPLIGRIKDECGVEPFDVIYDIDSIVTSFQPAFERAGYTLVHREEGFVISNSSGIPTDALFVPNVMYVRNDLLPLLDNPELCIVKYKDIPLHNRPERVWIDRIRNWIVN